MAEITFEVLPPSRIRRQEVDDVNTLALESRPAAKFLTLGEAQAADKNQHLFVARTKERRIIGVATLLVYQDEGDRVGRIEDEIVAAQYRDRGIGKQLAELLIKTARKLNLRRLFVKKPEEDREFVAQTLFFDLGFEPRRRDPSVLRLDL